MGTPGLSAHGVGPPGCGLMLRALSSRARSYPKASVLVLAFWFALSERGGVRTEGHTSMLRSGDVARSARRYPVCAPRDTVGSPAGRLLRGRRSRAEAGCSAPGYSLSCRARPPRASVPTCVNLRVRARRFPEGSERRLGPGAEEAPAERQVEAAIGEASGLHAEPQCSSWRFAQAATADCAVAMNTSSSRRMSGPQG